MKEKFENTKPIRHCNQVLAFKKEGELFLKCKKCKEWVSVKDWGLHGHNEKKNES